MRLLVLTAFLLAAAAPAFATPASDAAKQLVGQWSTDIKQSEPAGTLHIVYVFRANGSFAASTTHSGFPNQKSSVTGGTYAVTETAKAKPGTFVLTTAVADNDDVPETLQTAAEFTLAPNKVTFADSTVLKR